MIDRGFFEFWQPLTDHDGYPSNAFGRIHTDLSRYLREPEPNYAIGNGLEGRCPSRLVDSASEP